MMNFVSTIYMTCLSIPDPTQQEVNPPMVGQYAMETCQNQDRMQADQVQQTAKRGKANIITAGKHKYKVPLVLFLGLGIPFPMPLIHILIPYKDLLHITNPTGEHPVNLPRVLLSSYYTHINLICLNLLN